MKTSEDKFNELRFENAMKLQTRMMELSKSLQHDSLINEEEESSLDSEEDFDEDDWDEEEEEESNPIHDELYMLMELYRALATRIQV